MLHTFEGCGGEGPLKAPGARVLAVEHDAANVGVFGEEGSGGGDAVLVGPGVVVEDEEEVVACEACSDVKALKNYVFIEGNEFDGGEMFFNHGGRAIGGGVVYDDDLAIDCPGLAEGLGERVTQGIAAIKREDDSGEGHEGWRKFMGETGRRWGSYGCQPSGGVMVSVHGERRSGAVMR